MKLISMTDFVLKTHNEISDSIDSKSMMFNYANFLKQPLNLGMFVPCDLDGNFLEKPCEYYKLSCINKKCSCYYYQQAEKRVLFEGFKASKTNRDKIDVIVADYCCLRFSELPKMKIEDLVKYNLEIRNNAF